MIKADNWLHYRTVNFIKGEFFVLLHCYQCVVHLVAVLERQPFLRKQLSLYSILLYFNIYNLICAINISEYKICLK